MPSEYFNEEKPESALPVEAPSLENMSAAERAAGVLPVSKGGTGTNTGSIRAAGSFKLETTADPKAFSNDDIPSIHLQAYKSQFLGVAGGRIRLSGGTSKTTGAGGSIEILAGNGDSAAASTDESTGGSIDITGGTGYGAGTGGSLTLTAGNGGSDVGGSITLNGGSGGTNTDGGNVTLHAGALAGTGNDGEILFRQPGSTNSTFLKHQLGRTATTDATQTTAYTKTLSADSMINIQAFVSARRTGGTGGTNGDCAGYVVIGTYQKVGAGGATLVGSVTAVHTAENQAAWDATFTVSGNNVLLSVTGAANNNITWRWHIQYISI